MIRHGVVLREEFVRANFPSGHSDNPVREFYMKVMPKGSTDLPGMLPGLPDLDSPPCGLGWQIRESRHYFSGMQIHMPRTELQKRTAQREQLKSWLETDVPTGVPAAGVEHCMSLSEASKQLSSVVCAFWDGPDIQLGPYEQAMVPATCGSGWIGGETPGAFMAVGVDAKKRMSASVGVIPGVFSPKDTEFMLCTYNALPVEIRFSAEMWLPMLVKYRME